MQTPLAPLPHLWLLYPLDSSFQIHPSTEAAILTSNGFPIVSLWTPLVLIVLKVWYCWSLLQPLLKRPGNNRLLLLLLLLSRFSRVRLCATPQTAAHQALPSLGFSRQEHWSGLPFPSPMHESESEVTQSCLTLRNPMDYSPSGSSIHGIFQARVLEWGAIAFSSYWLY